MKLVILESPYAGDISANIMFARRCIHDCLVRDEAPIASHLLFTQPGVLRDEDPAERALGIAAGLAWLPRADYSVFYTDRGWSSGMLAALHLSLEKKLNFYIRALDIAPRLPATLDEDIEFLLKQHIEGNRETCQSKSQSLSS